VNLIEVEEAVVQWSHDRGILTNGKAITQCLKLMSELGELADNLAKDNCVKDDIGDCFVVLTNIARLENTTLVECANIAYEDIKDRKGFLNENGNFIKSTDPKYNQLLMEFESKQEPKLTIQAISVDQITRGFENYKIVCLLLNDNSTEEFKFYPKDLTYQQHSPQDVIGYTLEQAKDFFRNLGEVA